MALGRRTTRLNTSIVCALLLGLSVAINQHQDFVQALVYHKYPSSSLAPAGCPSECHCNALAHIADCSDRNLTRIPARFPEDIKRIRLERNNITEIGPYAFRGLKRLTRIDLSNNNIQEIDSLALSGGLQSLNTLILFNNKIQSLPPDVFTELSNLQILLLNANSLRAIHKDLFRSLTNLNLLSLYDNSIVNLASGTFTALKSIKTIHLGKNPLNCDCNLRWLFEYFETNPTVETSEARCEQPARNQGKRLSQLDKTELKCQEATSASKLSPYGDQFSSGSCPAGCVCEGATVDCSGIGGGVVESSLGSQASSSGTAGQLYELPDVPDDLPVYMARVHINDNRIKRIRQTGLFKKLINSQKLDLGNNKIVDIEDNAINGHLPNGQKPERVIFVLLENQHCDGGQTGRAESSPTTQNGQQTSPRPGKPQPASSSLLVEESPRDACALAPKVNEPQFDSACYNGGQCRPIASAPQMNFTCQCPVGFSGPLCELNIDDCEDHQCQNGAMCVDGINSYKCICRDATTSGEYCEQLSSNNLQQFDTTASFPLDVSTRPLALANSIAPLALPIVSQANSSSSQAQQNELNSIGQKQQQARSAPPQIQARSADFLRQPDDLASNSLQSQAAATGVSGAKSGGACHRVSSSRYYDDGNGCQSVRLLKMNECEGSCESAGGGACCMPTKIKRRRILMQCNDGASYVKMVDLVKKCSCSIESGASCPANASELLVQTASSTRRPSPPVSTTPVAGARKQYFKYTPTGVAAARQQDQSQTQTSRTANSGGGGGGGGGEQLATGGLDQEDQIVRLDAVE